MYSVWVWLSLPVFVWLGILSFLVWRQGNFVKSLFPKSGERDVRKKFEEIFKEVESFRLDLRNLKQEVGNIEKDGLGHIQRVEFLRFNPYGDTGGDQSFTACLLDKKGNGFVLTSLHARSGTRIFAKPVILGRGRYELSKEESAVVKKALES